MSQDVIDRSLLDAEYMKKMTEHEDTHWRTNGIRKMVIDFWKKYRKENSIYYSLDVGCGGGAMVNALAHESVAFGLDLDLMALTMAQDRGLNRLTLSLADRLAFKSASFDLITAIDVVEHTDNPDLVFAEFNRVTKKDGVLITIIPAFNFLWSQRDVELKHRKRYRVKEIEALAKKSGFKILKCSYAHFFYFLPLLFVVRWGKLFHKIAPASMEAGVVPPPPLLNKLFLNVLKVESEFLELVDFPFGVSTIAVLQKTRDIVNP